jgi:hypothetical protein
MGRLFVFFSVLLLIATARAEEVSATAQLSESSTSIGEPVELQIEITGARSPSGPPDIAVDGLSIEYIGRTQQFRSFNFDVQSSIVYRYSVTPERAGTFVIPAQTIEANGAQLQTQPLTLSVGKTAGGSSTAGKGDAWAELIVPKQSAYVGESIPVELRLYFGGRGQPRQPPTITGEGFTVQRFSEPRVQQVTKEGVPYVVVTFKTAITPVKDGTLAIGPAEADSVVQSRRRRAPHLDIDDPFGSDFFNDPFAQFSTRRQVVLKSEPVMLEVKPLPKAGQPKNFSGAVGQFDMETSAKPSKVQAGEPVTLTLKIKGRGNFDRVTAPELAEGSGWRAYPPATHFRADDLLGLSGVKSFEFAMVPEQKLNALPQLEFSYFDPATERYETLKSDALPVQVEGIATAPTPQRSAEPARSAAPKPTPNELGIREGTAKWGRSFIPFHEQPWFWAAQTVPAGALAALLFLGIRKRTAADPERLRRRQLLQERAEAKRRLRSGDEAETIEAATTLMRIDAALRTGKTLAATDAADVLATPGLDPDTGTNIRRIFDVTAAARYSGTPDASVATMLSRSEILDAVEQWERVHAKER